MNGLSDPPNRSITYTRTVCAAVDGGGRDDGLRQGGSGLNACSLGGIWAAVSIHKQVAMAEAAAAPACDGGAHNDEEEERVIRSEVHHGDHGADSAAEEEEEESKGLRTTAYRFRLLQVDADGDAVVPRRQRRREDEVDEQDGDGVLTVRSIIAVLPNIWRDRTPSLKST